MMQGSLPSVTKSYTHFIFCCILFLNEILKMYCLIGYNVIISLNTSINKGKEGCYAYWSAWILV